MKCYMKSRSKHHIPPFLYASSPTSTEQKRTTWKLRVMFYSLDKTEDLSLENNLWNTAPKRCGRSWDTREFLQQRPGSQNIKRLLLIKENQLSQFKEFSAFLCMERCKSMGSLKSFLWYAPQLSFRSEYPVLFHPESPQGAWWGRGRHSLCLLTRQAICIQWHPFISSYVPQCVCVCVCVCEGGEEEKDREQSCCYPRRPRLLPTMRNLLWID